MLNMVKLFFKLFFYEIYTAINKTLFRVRKVLTVINHYKNYYIFELVNYFIKQACFTR